MPSSFMHKGRPLRVGALALLLPIAALLGLRPAFAHAHLVRSNPSAGAKLTASPDTVTIVFSEGVVPRLSGIAIVDAAGKSVAAGAPASAGGAAALKVAIDKTLAPGTYKVSWHAVSVDSHRTQGQFSFTVAP